MTPVLRGWISYFRLTKAKGVLEELDVDTTKTPLPVMAAVKRVYTRARNLMKAGLDENRAW